MNKKQLEIEERRKKYEESNPVVVKHIINKRKIFPKSAEVLLLAAMRGEPLPKVRFTMTKTRKRFIKYFKDERKAIEKRGYKLPPEYVREQNRLAEQKDVAKKKRNLNYGHLLHFKDYERPFFDFSPVEQY